MAAPQLSDDICRETIELVDAHGGVSQAARSLGMPRQTLQSRYATALARQRANAIKPKGTAGFVTRGLTKEYDADGNVTGEWHREAPRPVTEPGGEDAGPARDGGDGYVIRGVSTYYDAAGEQRGQWVKTKLDDQAFQAAMHAACDAMVATIPRVAPVPAPPAAISKLCNLFTITDAHIGMLAWHKEGGDDWDVSIAESILVAAFSQMIASAPRARIAVLNQLGDLLHYDSLEAVTPSHRHILDADSRFRKVVAVAIRVLRRIIDMLLATHDEVHVVIAEGNHDLASSAWLQAMFAALYENEARLSVNDAMLPYYVYQHGRVMLGFTHGHVKKPGQGVVLHFAASYAEMWGATTKRYIHMGNLHHVDEKEHAGAKVVQHATLAAKDAYAARGGWLSERQAIAITYHEDHGEVGRITVTPEMLSA